MSRDTLHQLFTDLADEVPAPQLAGRTLGLARQRRRRNRAAVAASAGLAVMIIGAAVAFFPDAGGPSAPATAGPAVSATDAAIDRLPATLTTWTDYGWPASLDPPRDTPSVYTSPIARATVLYAPYDPNNPDAAPRVYAWGEGNLNQGSGNGNFGWVDLDLDLQFTHDADGNQALPVGSAAIGANGVRAAFAQPDELVVINFMTTEVTRIPLPGINERVAWLPDGRNVLVSSDSLTRRVNVETRAIKAATAPAGELAVASDGPGAITLTTPANPGDDITADVFDDAGTTKERSVAIRPTVAGFRVDYIYGQAWRSGERVVVGGSGLAGNNPGDFIAVIDLTRGSVTRMLDLTGDRDKGCCRALGWADAQTVYVWTDQDGLLRWDLAERSVVRVFPAAPGVVAVLTAGCPKAVTIDGFVTSCIE